MSTYYYNFRPPISSATIDDRISHVRVTLFGIEQGNIGTLTFAAQNESAEFLRLLTDPDPAAQIVSTGAMGRVKYLQHKSFTGTALLSDYGDIVRANRLEELVRETREKGGVAIQEAEKA